MGMNRNLVDTRHPDYQSYLLRVWRTGGEGPWRGSLQSTATEHTCHFETIEALFACLMAQLAECGGAGVEPAPL